MLDLPDQFLTLQTPRLILRKLAITDAEDIFAYASDPQVTTYTAWETHRSINETYEYLNNFVFQMYRSGKGMNWGIVMKENGKLIGTCSLHTAPVHRRAELGYVLSRNYWGNGLMTEAAKSAIAFGFHVMQLQRIQAICDVNNVSSARVLEKAEMQFEGILHNYLFYKERSWDVKMYAITRSLDL
ncbi:GNAT family N-acetyltransferase [Pseudanabaena sp. SR411]|uniref:GNAT family N-acetyltransferase n=1 Tax=Pseudanabaena sp. SR411 TaxID=1980935 RepID=UPI000B98B36F|nr:GNAT family N-acetyltransferase [Pseudanabaena sp. SR411]OYQ62845.1 GNAT family N-acetyltransferase [Pseudanabaena sp. SR411]